VEIGHIEIPLSSLDLTPGKLNNFKLKIPRTGAKSKVPAPSDKEMPSQREMKRSAQGGSDSVQVQRTHADLSDLLASESSHVDGELAPGEDAGQLHKLMGTSMAQLTDMAHAIGMPTSKDCVVEVEVSDPF